MFVLSEKQTRTLLNLPDNDKTYQNVADLGAGDGNVSIRVAKALNLPRKKLKVTDVSPTMTYRLREKGFTVANVTHWFENEVFDAVFMLNLLDRCKKPYSMLKQAHQALTDAAHGRLVISLVFPIKQSVEWRKSRLPDEKLSINKNEPLEEQITKFVEKIMAPAGFELEKFSKVPYLSEGDINNPYYSLTNIAMVFKKVSVK